MINPSIIPDKAYEHVSKHEDVPVSLLKDRVSAGEVVIFYNPNHKDVNPIAVGKGLKIKINANIGTSPSSDQSKAYELDKIKLCEKYDVDAIMDLSLGQHLREHRKNIIASTKIPIGTVPLYDLFNDHCDYPENAIDLFLDNLDKQGQDGVDFVVIHAALQMKHFEYTKDRVIKITSRGGSLMKRWMEKHGRENFLLENFDKVLEVCKKYNITMSLGDSLRPATIIDETDQACVEEMKDIGKLVLRSREAGVQSIVEGPGHVPFHRIPRNIQLQKKYCYDAPFYVLGPLVTDIAPGYDHITSAIGATYAASSGADFLCYVTPAEHLALPDLDDVKEGIIAYKIAAHAADLTRGKDTHLDLEMSKARANLDWATQRKYALDKDKFDFYRKKNPEELDTCTMCSEFCALK
jgi:phosphomethylpyrimidine synthase